jgi:acyl-[acyl-carrier-protein]-phospholipid O-acyltransferase/long-chain-fatty-acid--[acyl-carrier-protein] ligase
VIAAFLLVVVVFLALGSYGRYRLWRWLVSHSYYWLEVRGRENVPRRGPALLVCHFVQDFDWLFVLAAQRRIIRFVIATGSTDRWLVGRILSWTGAIVLDGASGPEDAERAVQEARGALARGELVCLFAQEVSSDRGLPLPYGMTFERIVNGLSVPIIPVALAQEWGSLVQIRHGSVAGARRRWPPWLPYHVEVSFGKPVPAPVGAGAARQAAQALSAESAILRNSRRPPVHRQFVRMAARHPFRSCLLDSTTKQELSYGKALAGAMCLARALKPRLGDAPMVGLWLPPSIGGVLANVGLAFLRKTSVNLNYTSSPTVVQSALRQCGARHVLTSRKFTHKVPLDPGPGVELIYLEDVAAGITNGQRLRAFLKVLLLPGWVLDHWVLGLGRHQLADLATVIFSSGSTGEPKGVMLTHGNVAGNVESMIQAAQLEPADRALGVLPLFHSFGYTVTLWAPLQIGASVLYHVDPRQAREIGELCQNHRCTVYLTTPTFLRFCVKKCAPEDFRTLRLLICGAEKLPISLSQEFRDKFGVQPLEGYGCTELSPVTATNLPDEHINGLHRRRNKSGTIGPPIPGVAGQVVHPETGHPLPVGEDGLVLMTGPNVMLGYLGKPELTSQVLREGWYVTGDMGRVDEEGYFTLTGRMARFAKVGGEMVPLERIEEELHLILQTTERVCAVTCVPDESRGERLVVLHLGTNGVPVRSLCQQLGARGLPNLWLPSERDFFQVPELPLLGSGKVNLQRVKELALELARR